MLFRAFKIFTLITTFVASVPANSGPLEDFEKVGDYRWYSANIRIPDSHSGEITHGSPHVIVEVGEFKPMEGVPVVGDILYFHGFGDNYKNHVGLFSEWVKKGFRVITFNYPQHGRSFGDFLGRFGIRGLAWVGQRVEQIYTSSSTSRPLFLAGWSTGGLVVTRTLQGAQGFPTFSRPVRAAITYAPGVKVKLLIGEYGFVTNRTLVHGLEEGAAALMPATPISPFLTPLFALDLLRESKASRTAVLSTEVPLLVFSAGSEDMYVNSGGTKDWVEYQTTKDVSIAHVVAENAYHGLDNESDIRGGSVVRDLSAVFFATAASATPDDLRMNLSNVVNNFDQNNSSSPCKVTLNLFLRRSLQVNQ